MNKGSLFHYITHVHYLGLSSNTSDGVSDRILNNVLTLALFLNSKTFEIDTISNWPNRTIQPYRGRVNFIFNQSVENAGVAFGKGANERNEFFEKINKQ